MSTTLLPQSFETSPAQPQVVAPSAYVVTVERDLAAFKAMAEEWQSLLERSGETSVFLSHNWLLGWLEHFPARLFIVLVRDAKGVLVGAAPLKISQGASGLFCRLVRSLQFIGTDPEVYDWTRLLIAANADHEAVLRAIGSTIRTARGEWDVLDFRYMLDKAQAAAIQEILAPVAAQVKPEESLHSAMSVAYLALPAEETDTHKLIKRNLRNTLKKARNKLTTEFPEQPVTLELLSPSRESDDAFSRFIELHSAYWASKGWRSNFRRFPELAKFYKRMHRRYSATRQFTFSRLMLGKTPLSYLVCVGQGRQATLAYLNAYCTEYARFSPGSLHLEAVLQEALRLGYGSFEFGRGDENYKTHWTETEYPVWNLKLYRHTAVHWLEQLDAVLKNVITLKGLRK